MVMNNVARGVNVGTRGVELDVAENSVKNLVRRRPSVIPTLTTVTAKMNTDFHMIHNIPPLVLTALGVVKIPKFAHTPRISSD